VLQVVTDAVVNAGTEDGLLPALVSVPVPEPKLKPVNPDPKPENPVKPLNAAVCTVHNKHVHNSAMSNNENHLTV